MGSPKDRWLEKLSKGRGAKGKEGWVRSVGKVGLIISKGFVFLPK